MRDVAEAIRARRAYRALTPDPIGDDVVRAMAEAARLSPSANNTQPWRMVFVRDAATVEELRDHQAFPDFNEWVYRGAMFVAVCGLSTDDAVVPVEHKSYSTDGDKTVTSQRPLYLLDLGIAAAFMMLRATEFDLVAHPIAGYDEPAAKQVLNIPEEFDLVTMLIVGRKSLDPKDVESLPPDLQKDEETRPPRKPLGEIAFTEKFGQPII